MTLKNSPISNKKFGIYFSGFFAAASLWGLINYYSTFFVLLFTVASFIFLVLAVISPQSISLPNKLWFALGELLGKVTGPLVLGTIFFGIITPVGIIGKWFGRDILALKKTKKVTYWKDRQAQSRPPSSFNNQF
jgi:polyferredoxin